MTREEILAMKPGRELDALVAEKVMGWEAVILPGETIERVSVPIPAGIRYDIFKPSTDISAAWEVVERLSNFDCDITREKDTKLITCQFSTFEKGDPETFERYMAEDVLSAPEAICKAALLATTGE